MEKKYKAILFIVGLSIALIYLQYCREPNVCSTKIESFDNGYYENISIVSNKVYFFDKENFAEQLIQKVRNNTLKNVLFSYDLQGYPNGLYISVYINDLSYSKGNCSFVITYLQDIKYDFQYNIKDNPEKFVLEVKPR